MAKPVPLPPILQGQLSAPFLGTPTTAESPKQIANSSTGWRAFVHATEVVGPHHLRNAKNAGHALDRLIRNGR